MVNSINPFDGNITAVAALDLNKRVPLHANPRLGAAYSGRNLTVSTSAPTTSPIASIANGMLRGIIIVHRLAQNRQYNYESYETVIPLSTRYQTRIYAESTLPIYRRKYSMFKGGRVA